MSVIGKQISANGKIFTVKESCDAGGIRVPDAFKKYGPSIIKHKDLDFLYTNQEIREKYFNILQEIYPVISKLMGANSAKKGEIVPLGELDKENGKFYVEGSFRGKTTRMYLFSEKQAKAMNIALTKPAFAAIEDGYNIVNVSKDAYSIDVPEIALPNLRVYYGSFKNGELRYIDAEFSIPVGEISDAFDINTTRKFYSFKPGPAVRGYSVFSYGGRFGVGFGFNYGRIIDGDRLGRFGVLGEQTGAQAPAAALLK
ncbi:hypothetical protein COU37_04615 [Candidatus Micrarchaeota archaeon CG10_big_fil_rev_8_21_14_0_10_45_29]|nr:MAG: hypothetical protein COU37_04615 [Candidatus Micrarchaeota archaeon CG10_big_fil_rev_8_21_14_0_10_45_29]